MTSEDARAHYNYLMTLCIRREEAFGPMALAFIREPNFGQLGLSPEEQFNLYMATAEAFTAEPKRYPHKLECLQKANELLSKTSYWQPGLARHLLEQIRKTTAELEIYNEAMRVPKTHDIARQRMIVETDVPEYFLDIAQKRAASYYQTKYRLGKEAKTAQHFGSTPKNFEPDNPAVHKEFPGACPPFLAARTNAFHMMLPFDLKISRTPDDPLEAGVRIFYAKLGYSYPLRYEMGKLCSYQDGRILEIPLDDPHLLFVSASRVKDTEFTNPPGNSSSDVPPEFLYPLAILEHTGSLGPFIQVSCNFKVWFDAAVISLLVQGAPDLAEHGLQGGMGMMTRTYASDKVQAYVESFREPWQEGLSYNFVNLHLQLLEGRTEAMVPYNTPIFSVYPVLNRQNFKFEDRSAFSSAPSIQR
ncbi:hypothetical protein [Petrachloros mirabilis]